MSFVPYQYKYIEDQDPSIRKIQIRIFYSNKVKPKKLMMFIIIVAISIPSPIQSLFPWDFLLRKEVRNQIKINRIRIRI